MYETSAYCSTAKIDDFKTILSLTPNIAATNNNYKNISDAQKYTTEIEQLLQST